MVEIEGVVNGEPVPTSVPPEGALYHSIVSPGLTDAEIITVPVPHLALLTAFAGGFGSWFTVAVTGVLADTQPVFGSIASA